MPDRQDTRGCTAHATRRPGIHWRRAPVQKAWMFVGSELAGQRAAMVMSLVQAVRLNGQDPFAYLSDVLRRLLTQRNSRIEELLPHRWSAPTRHGDTAQP